MDVINGNLDKLVDNHPDTKGWFFGFGSFMARHPEFESDKASIKWVRRKEGQLKHGDKTISSQKTVVILIEGKIQLNFPTINESIELNKIGDFALYDTIDSDHTSIPLRDSLILVVRTAP